MLGQQSSRILARGSGAAPAPGIVDGRGILPPMPDYGALAFGELARGDAIAVAA